MGCEYNGPVGQETASPIESGMEKKPSSLLQPSPDPRASELEDMSEWSAQQLQPKLPGQWAGSAGSSSPASHGLSADPGSYEVHLLCEGAPAAEFSVSSWAGAEVLAPARVPCNGDVFKAPVELLTQGADFSMAPSNEGAECRYAFRLVPTHSLLPP
jgi:hypothetical protein